MIQFTVLRPKTYSYLTDENDEKKAKGTKSVSKKENLNLNL